MCSCNSNCGCSSSQNSGKCNIDSYSSEIVYDGAKFGCDDLASVKPNCTPLNKVLELFASLICSILSRLTTLEGASGFAFAFFQKLVTTYEWVTDLTIVPDMNFTALVDGNYQVHVTSNNDMNKGASADLHLYIDDTAVSSVRIGVDASDENSIKEASIIWRGAVTAGQVISVKAQKLNANTIHSKAMNMLINKE